MKRRNAMQLVVLGAASPLAAQEAHTHTPAAAVSMAPPRLRFFTAAQNALVDRLSEMIIPSDAHSPGAHGAGVSAFIDEVLADSQPDEQKAWTSGLQAVDTESTKRYGKSFVECKANQQSELLKDMADGEENPKTDLHRFFVNIKRQTLSGYYTSSIGLLKDLQYKGIVPLAAYPPCDHPEHKQAKPARTRK